MSTSSQSRLKPAQLELLMARVFIALSVNQDIASPPRINLAMASHTALFMPSRIADVGTGIKIVSVPLSTTDTRGLPGTTLVLDEDTGSVKAVVNARNLTALRNAAGSLLATRLMGHPNPTRFMAFGAGAQIKAHTILLLQAYPSITEVYIVNRTLDRLITLIASLRADFPKVTFTALESSSRDLIESTMRRGIDIICTATSSNQPLFPSEWVQPGTHLNLIGSYKPTMHEVGGELIRRAVGSLVVDSREMCATEAGELIAAGVKPEEMVEIGELVEIKDERVGRRIKLPSSDVTIFKSVGVGLQDVAIADAVVKKGELMGLGVCIEEYERGFGEW